MRLGLRLLLGLFLMVGLGAYFVLSIFSAEVKPGVRQGMEVALVDAANLLAEVAAEDLDRRPPHQPSLAKAFERYRKREFEASIWGLKKQVPELRLYVTDAEGIVRYDSQGVAEGQNYSRWNDVARTLKGQYGARATRLLSDDPASSAMHVAAPILLRGKLIGVLTLVAPTASVQPFAHRSERRIRQAGAILLGASLLIGLALTWWLTRDIRRLRAYARDLGLDGRPALPSLGAPELKELGSALESMRTRLDGRDYVERHVQTLTHEMKSPLSAIRGAAELLQEPLAPEDHARFTGNILEQASRLHRLVERMLTLATLQQRQALDAAASLDFSELCRKVAAGLEPLAARRSVAMTFLGPDHCKVTGERFLLEQAVENLLDNALSFAPSGSSVVASLQVGPNDLTLSIRDQGPGLPPFALDKVFQPFFSLPRPDGKTKGTGLGLCLAQEAAKLHRGRATLENHPDGGAVSTLYLPR